MTPEPPPAPEPPPEAPAAPAWTITLEEWIASTQACCGIDPPDPDDAK